MENVQVNGVLTLSKEVKMSQDSLHGKQYNILPAVMMVEGSYYPSVSGSDKPEAIFFNNNQMKSSVNTWNGRPIALNHPSGNKSCNSPEVLKSQWLGYVFNTEYDDAKKRLTCEMWLESKRSADIIDQINSGKNIDVSIGAFGDVFESNGVAPNGSEYNYEMKNIVGDHLAILPNSKGACSWDDGCGIRAEDSQSKDIKSTREEKQMAKDDNVVNVKKETACSDPLIEEPKQVRAETPKMDVDAFLASAPPEIREILMDQKETYMSLKNGLIINILDFEEVKFDEDFLGSLKRCQLEKISAVVDCAKNNKDLALEEKKVNVAAVNYSVGKSNKLEDETTWMPPASIDWTN